MSVSIFAYATVRYIVSPVTSSRRSWLAVQDRQCIGQTRTCALKARCRCTNISC